MKISYINFINKKPKRMKENKIWNKKLIPNFKKLSFENIKLTKNFKKNQVAMFGIALMLATAGYLNYTNNTNSAEIGDAKLVSSEIKEESIVEQDEKAIETAIVEESNKETNAIDNSNVTASNEVSNVTNNKEETINTSSKVKDDYFTNTKIERNKMYSQMLESYQKILGDDKIPSDQKSIATNEIKNINNKQNAISIIENLSKTKGFEDMVILINDNNIDVVVKKKEKLKDEQVAQITNIVSRELNANIEDIHISIKE